MKTIYQISVLKRKRVQIADNELYSKTTTDNVPCWNRNEKKLYVQKTV